MGNVRMRAEQINYGASNVKVALDDLDPMDLIALSDRMDAIEAWKATVKADEKTGAEVTFTNALALAAVTLSTEIEASQDLHGYDKPWVGGADVNKFDISSATMAGLINVFGLTVAKDSDGFITITGTYTGESDIPKFAIIPALPVLADAVFYLMDKNTDATNNVIQCRWANNETGGVAIDLQNMVQNQTYNIKFRLMIVTDGTTPTSYRPYSNICPISGRTAVTITDYDSESNTATVTIQLGQTVYGGTLNVTTGVLTVTHANIASYNGETIGEPWISSMDEYTEGGTPTTGAQVVYPLAAPTTIQLTPEQLTMLKGYNRLSSDGGGAITVEAYTGSAWGGDTI